jgi:hypothetical protein
MELLPDFNPSISVINHDTIPYFIALQKSNVSRIFVNSKGGDILSAIHIAEICHTPLIVIKAISSSAVMTLLIKPQFRFVLPSGFLFLHPLTCNKSCLNDEEFDLFLDFKSKLPHLLSESNPQYSTLTFETWLKGRCFSDNELQNLFSFSLAKLDF